MASSTIYSGLQFQSVCNRLNGSTLNGGSNTEGHMPVGWSSTTDSRWRALIKFPNISAAIPGGAKIVKAEVWVKTTGSNVHVGKGSNARMKISRCTQNWTAGGGSGEGWYTNASTVGFSVSSTTAITYAAEGNPGNGVVKKYDVTDFVEDWLPANYIRRDGGACRGASNYGIEIKSYDENSSTRTSEFWSTRSGYEPRLVVEYTTEADPVAPSITDPTAGDKLTAPTSATVQWAAGTGDEGRLFIGSAEDAADIWDSGWNACTPGAEQVFDLSAAALPVGQTLFFEARSRNDLGVVAQSPSTQVYILPIPTVSIAHPGSGGRCHIHNLNELAVWTSGGLHAKPRVEVNYVHPTGVAAQEIEVSVDNGATWHSFPGVASGATAVCDVDQTVYRATDFVIKARATGGAGQQSAEVSLTARVNFSQVVLAFDPSASNSDYVTAHAPVQGGSRAQAAYAYRVSGGSWVKTVGELPSDLATGEMMVRLSTSDAAQPPSVADLTLQYQSTPPPAPDFWEATAAAVSLDPQVRRFGVHSMKVVPTGAGWVKNSDPVIVSPDTEYTMSAYVNTLGATLAGVVAVGYIDQNGLGVLIPGTERETNDSTGKGKENWQRIYGTFTTGPDTTELTPAIYHHNVAQFRLDSAQLESGPVASSWRPGTLGPAVILDVGGVAIDGQAGGIFRARGSGGEVVTLGANGLEKDGVPYVTDAEVTHPTPTSPTRQTFTASGTWNKPAGLLYADVEVIGGGGGGGGCLGHSSNQSAASGGGGGGYCYRRFLASELPSSCVVTVGAGGAGGAAGQNHGNAGGDSVFNGTTFTAIVGGGGGAGEAAGTALNQYHHGGVGGSTSGDFEFDSHGQQGDTSFAISGYAVSARGGANGRGNAGRGAPENWHGAGGIAYGTGGSGGANAGSASTVNRSGGDGANGVVIVTEYYQ